MAAVSCWQLSCVLKEAGLRRTPHTERNTERFTEKLTRDPEGPLLKTLHLSGM